MRREWLRSTKPHPPAIALSARNGIFGCGDRAPEIAERDNVLPQRLKRRRTDSGNPRTNGLLEPDGKIPGSVIEDLRVVSMRHPSDRNFDRPIVKNQEVTLDLAAGEGFEPLTSRL